MKKLLGKRIKEIRKTRELTQEKLAELVDLETSSLSAIESGRAFPSMVTLEKLSHVLQVPLKVFFDFSEEKTIDDMKSSIAQNVHLLPDKVVKYIYDIAKIYFI